MGVLAMLLVVASACASVLASLAAEKVLKEEGLPFHVQKVSLDLGSAVATLILLPIIGLISTRPQDAYWKYRPLDARCSDSSCWEQSSSGYCANSACSCDCNEGVFVAWNDWMVI